MPHGVELTCLDRQGGLLHSATIYLEQSAANKENAARTISLVERYAIEAVAIGNGTASRETETFIHELGLPKISRS